ncbi:MoaC-domain-containing protein [Cucurbitaria berberidis CBS 394.84]|uniref:cyclic pyranopterin monophosphate synthase n=1 Tax=Cucurbitaria berberidis CBS 394.84 TaxID=1168544 RepID=A0A9P4GEF1_9PLEO|nr:MoaC-domain-containing protein [Cucurbitaria berberidis CBS 394.84]KAF1844097.1 MoaC-domain-containing protein [Cucurbitaria berberidis CBS 394.84]
MNQHQPKGAHATPLSLGRSVLPLLSSVSPSMISLRAFSTTPTPAAKHEYQTKNPRLEQNVSFKKVNQFLTRFSSGEDTERLGTRAPVASVKNLAIDTRELREFLGEIGLPQARKRLLKGIESKIRELESRIAGAKFFDVATDPGDWKQFSVSADKIMTGLNPKNERATKRSLWRERKRTSALLNEGQVDFDAEYKKLEDVQQKEISDMEAILDMYKAHAETIKAVLNGAEDLEKVRMQKRRLLSKKHELSKQLEKEKEEAQWAKTTRRFIPAKERETKAESFDLGDILDDAFIKAGGATEAMPELDMATFMPQPPSYGGSQQLKRISESNSTFKKFTARTPAAERISAMGGGLGGDVKPTTTKEMDMSSRSSNEDSLPSDLHPASNYDQTVPTPQRQPSDNLRLQVPQSGLISIDPDFTANFDTEVSDLQSQILQLQERLKSSYPRIDTLPFDVWTSNNQRTLRTWLKILVTRWQTRFDDAGGSSNNEEVKTSRVDENVKAVLDQMVRDHDLSNDAAERMARRWGQVFEKRGDIGGDAEGVLDWEEFDAVGMGFLKEGADSYVAEGRRSNSRDASFRAQNKGRIGFGQLSYKPLTRRLYSTSSRAASDPELSKDAKTTTSGPQQPSSQPSLPHLTSTGSAHMVSVSAKAHTVRTAIAVGTVYFSNPTPLSLIRSNSLKKGDVLSVSRIAGIMAAKKCPDLIPLCHPIALTHVGIELDVLDAKQSEGMGFGGVAVEAKVQCTGPTGVEMEALTAVMGATLTVVDMVKAVDKFQRVQDVRVVLKEGGKSGTWREEGWCSFQSPRVEG